MFALVLLPTKLFQQSRFFKLNEKSPGKEKILLWLLCNNRLSEKIATTPITLKSYYKLQIDLKILIKDLKKLQKAKVFL